MNILAIESSCDETAAAVLSYDKKNPSKKLLSNVVISQINIFKEYGGVIPEVAARSHLEAILPVVHKALSDASLTWSDIDSIAVTNTPGLLGSLLIGTLTARTLSILHNLPLYPIHHLKSHIYSAFLDKECEFEPEPTLALIVSGGHTQILYMKSPNSFEIIGTTLDDAVGEAFDKIAKILGLPYPGGPSIAKAAKSGNPEKYHFPHPNVEGLNFSFSGLKTAVLRQIQKELNLPLNYPSHDIKNLLSEEQIADFAASFQRTAVDILVEKLSLAKNLYPDVNNIVVAGGVSANEELRNRIAEVFCSGLSPNPQTPAVKNTAITKRVRGNVVGERETNRCVFDDCAARTRTNPEQETPTNIFFPTPAFSGDNAAMVALAALSEILSGKNPTSPYSLQISPRSKIS